MVFKNDRINLAETSFNLLGDGLAVYTPKKTGVPIIDVQVIIKRDFEINPGALMTGISEKTTMIELLYSQVPDPRSGDKIEINNEVFYVDSEIKNNNIKVGVSVING